MRPASRLRCSGCGAEPSPEEPYPFSCPNAGRGDGVDHVLRRLLDPGSVAFPAAGGDPNPFIAYRELLHPYHLARYRGLADADFCALVRDLDDRVAAVAGCGFRRTPLARNAALSALVGLAEPGGVYVKDETGNVAGSHKARHLFDVLIELEVAERTGLADRLARPPLAIASCGNAALAAATLAAAAGRTLQVFVPAGADPAILERLSELGARIEVCRRDGAAGDPSYRRLRAALAAGALPFTCQGDLNGLAVEGGMTLAYELVAQLAAQGVAPDRLLVQVGGGALASACYEGLADAHALGVLAALPRIDTVQTRGAWPLRRAYERFCARRGQGALEAELRAAASQRAAYMWPWESEPRSIAHGILDDETYDWLAVVEAMVATGGAPLVVDEPTLAEASRLAAERAGVPADATGAAGLAGLLSLAAAGELGAHERVCLLFTGAARTPTAFEERNRDEELSGQGHPVAQGL